MKLLKLLFALLFAVSMTTVSAQPNNAMCMPNKSGGMMMLTKVESKSEPGFRIAVSTEPGGRAIYGAWTVLGERTILITWTMSGNSSLFDISDFYACKF